MAQQIPLARPPSTPQTPIPFIERESVRRLVRHLGDISEHVQRELEISPLRSGRDTIGILFTIAPNARRGFDGGVVQYHASSDSVHAEGNRDSRLIGELNQGEHRVDWNIRYAFTNRPFIRMLVERDRCEPMQAVDTKYS